MARETFAKIWDDILSRAVQQRASDIHLGPGSEEPHAFSLSFRVGGLLARQETYPQALGLLLLDQLKQSSGLDVAERRLPQDGRLSSTLADFRVSTLPCLGGEKAVLRVLRRSERSRLKGLGLATEALGDIESALGKSSGLIVIAGATGSGKTTTIHALLGELDAETLNIVTLEDPVEYRAPGLSQVQTSPELSFARGLRSLLRQDPDVIFVGECRDAETAHLALEAAATGHLVLTTVHAGGVDQIKPRFVDLGCDLEALDRVCVLTAFQQLIPSPNGLRLDFQWRAYL